MVTIVIHIIIKSLSKRVRRTWDVAQKFSLSGQRIIITLIRVLLCHSSGSSSSVLCRVGKWADWSLGVGRGAEKAEGKRGLLMVGWWFRGNSASRKETGIIGR